MTTIPTTPQTALFQPADFATAGMNVTAPSLLSSAGKDFAANVLSSPQNISSLQKA